MRGTGGRQRFSRMCQMWVAMSEQMRGIAKRGNLGNALEYACGCRGRGSLMPVTCFPPGFSDNQPVLRTDARDCPRSSKAKS
jgi:hypothetical protein